MRVKNRVVLNEPLTLDFSGSDQLEFDSTTELQARLKYQFCKGCFLMKARSQFTDIGELCSDCRE